MLGRNLTPTLLEGSVRKRGSRIQIKVNLVDADTEQRLWSSTYDRSIDDILAVQSDITSEVVKAIPSRSRLNHPSMLVHGETRDITAYSEFLRARELLHETEESKIRYALALFESAIQKDPSFARAYVGKASCYRSLGMYAHIPFLEAIQSAKASLEKALAINDRLAEAYAVLAYIEGMEDNMDGEEVAARKAIELNPNLAEACSSLADYKLATGDIEGSIRLREKTYQLDPLEPWNLANLGQEYFWAGRESDALNIWETSMKLAPYITADSMMDYYLSKRDYAKAEETISQLRRLEPDNLENDFWTAYLAAIRGDSEKARKMIEKLRRSSEKGSVAINGIGLIYYALGDLDRFFEQMKKSKDSHTLTVDILRYSPLFAKARNDLRMKEILESYSRP